MNNSQTLASIPAVRVVLPVFSLLLLVAVLLIFWSEGLHQPYVQKDFSYSTGIVATTGVYDPVQKTYLPDRDFTGKFYYQVEQRINGIATIKSAIDASTITTITRTSDVKIEDGRYVPSGANPKGGAYLFAPHNLQPGKSFVTLHIPYDAPATMQFVGEEQLYGLKVYHYLAPYDGKSLIHPGSATDNLQPGQSLQYHPGLNMWFEPLSGWLVNVSDAAVVTVVDQATGSMVRPASRYAAHFTDNSVRQQVAYAKSLRSTLWFEQRIVPRLITAVLLALLLGVAGLVVYRRLISVKRLRRSRKTT